MVARRSDEQLSFQIAEPEQAELPRSLRPMVPLVGDGPFDDPDWFFEPWWPGASVLLYIEHERLRLQSEHMADPLSAFPELESVASQFSDRGLVVQGALLVLDDEGRPDAELLRRRLAHDGGSPGETQGQPALVASDLLYERGRPLLGLGFQDRRARLVEQLTDGDRCVVSRGLRGEGLTLAEALSSMGLREISARLLEARYRPGQRDGSWLRLPVAETPATTPTRPLLTVLQRLPL